MPDFGHFFALPNFKGQALQKLYARYHHWLTTRRLDKICDDIPISFEVMNAHTLNFKSNFKFSRLNFLGGAPIPIGVCASKLWSIYSSCKNLRVQHLLRVEIQSPEKCRLWSIYIRLNNFFVYGPKFTIFFDTTWEGW